MPEEHPDAEPSSTAGATTPAASGIPEHPLAMPEHPLETAGVPEHLDAAGAPDRPLAAAGVPEHPLEAAGVPEHPLEAAGVPDRPLVAAGAGATAAGSPKPGYFLPGGAGDILTEGDRARAAARRRSLDLGKARALTAPIDQTLRKKARPLPTDPGMEPSFGAPPPAPLPGAPVTPLAGTRRRVGSFQRTGWHQPYARTGAQFSTEAPPITPQRQYSKPVIAGLSAFVLLLVTGGTFAGFQLIDTYDNLDSPMARPTVRKSDPPLPIPPDPTVTVTVQPIPDLVRLQKNKLYTSGKVPSVSCKEPAIKPNSQSAILNYYKALLPCLNRAWEPVVKKAGYEFRPPKIALQSTQAPASTCTGEAESAYYCPADEVIAIDWQDDLEDYKEDPLAARVWMLDTMVHEYGHHVQELTHILTAAWSREGFAKTEPEKLEWSRRTELQATCLGALFLGANKKSMGLSGNKLRIWEWQTQHSGDEYHPKKIRDHGSRKNQWLWAGPAFKSTSLSACNTFTAPAKKVS